jgi:hypothetical protein
MRYPHALPRIAIHAHTFLFAALLVMMAQPCRAGFVKENAKWDPVPPEDMQLSAPVVDPDAGAEILLYECEVDDSSRYGAVSSYFTRLKVFDSRGVDQVKDFCIDTIHPESLISLAVRVIQPDGSVTSLKAEDVFEREIVRKGNNSLTRCSFSIPNLRQGCIVEYKWKTTWGGKVGAFCCFLGDVLSTRVARLRFFVDNRFDCHFNTFLIPNGMKDMGHRCWETEINNIPALPDDPLLPPRYSIIPWVFFYYSNLKIGEHWDYIGKDLWSTTVEYLNNRKRKIVREKTRDLIQGIDDPREKLRKIYNFCTHDIVNVNEYTSGYSREDINKMRENMGPSDTLKNKRGNVRDIRRLFCALASNAGFEVRVVRINDREYMDWNKECMLDSVVSDYGVAVKMGEKWELFQPGEHFLPFGMILRENEGTTAVVAGKKHPEFIQTPVTPSSASVFSRSGVFTIDEEGALKGNAVFAYSGHEARSAKFRYTPKAPKEREDLLKETVKEMIPNVDISEIVFKNLEDPDKDVEIRFHLEASGYADLTGGRLMFQPAIFDKDMGTIFKKDSRQYDIRFKSLHETHDNLRIVYPESFEVEEGYAPESLPDIPELGYTVSLGHSKMNHALILKKNLRIGTLGFPASSYPKLKMIFDAITTEDHHVITLHRIVADPSSETPQVAPTVTPPSQDSASAGQ